MAPAAELAGLKARVSARLLELPGVAGLGIAGGRLVVYLEADDPGVRTLAERVVREEDPEAPLDFVVSGPFRKR